jgi:hypothetical protein
MTIVRKPRKVDLILGVDPGKIPTMALLNVYGDLLEVVPSSVVSKTVKAKKKGAKGREAVLCAKALSRYIGNLRIRYGDPLGTRLIVVCEAVSIRKGEGTVSALSYAASAYVLEGICAAKHYDFVSVHPRTWKKGWSDKSGSLRRAIANWPEMQHHFSMAQDHNKAEAALIGAWFVEERLDMLFNNQIKGDKEVD